MSTIRLCHRALPALCIMTARRSALPPLRSLRPLHLRPFSSTPLPPSDLPSPPPANQTLDGFTDVPGVNHGGKKLAVVYTCTVCDTRSAKRFSQKAYDQGVVLVRCPGCQNLHLIADRLGYFEDKGDGGWDIEKFMKEHGDGVKAVNEDNVLELTMLDIMGKSTKKDEPEDSTEESKEEKP